MTRFKTWGLGGLLWLGATLTALAQQEGPPVENEVSWLLVLIIAAVVLIVVGAVVSYALRKPKVAVIVTKDMRDE